MGTTSPTSDSPNMLQSLPSSENDSRKNPENSNSDDDNVDTIIKALNMNDLRLSEHTATTQNSTFGNSSLSTFLSALLEDESSDNFVIINDNPKIVLEQRTNFRGDSVNSRDNNNNNNNNNTNGKLKSRWDYLVREESCDDALILPGQRQSLRCSSFSGRISLSSTKPPQQKQQQQQQQQEQQRDLHHNDLNSSSSSCINNKTKVETNCNNMVLKMPERQISPTGEGEQTAKESLRERFNQSDSDLLYMPTIPRRNSSSHNTDRKFNYNKSNHSTNGSSSLRRSNPRTSESRRNSPTTKRATTTASRPSSTATTSKNTNVSWGNTE